MFQTQNKESLCILYHSLMMDGQKQKGGGDSGQWIRFVNMKRAKWNPTKYSGICSAHFAKEDFTKRFVQMGGSTPRLIVDEVGVAPIPRFYERAEDKPVSTRHKRKVSIYTDYLYLVKLFFNTSFRKNLSSYQTYNSYW